MVQRAVNGANVSAVTAPTYLCTSCGWTGDNPAITERDEERFDQVRGYYTELVHSVVCRKCYENTLEILEPPCDPQK